MWASLGYRIRTVSNRQTDRQKKSTVHRRKLGVRVGDPGKRDNLAKSPGGTGVGA